MTGPNLIFIAGEASGDTLAAAVMDRLREHAPTARFAGIAGPAMHAQGCEAWASTEELSVLGLAEMLRHLPRLLRLRRRVGTRIVRARPDLLVTVDAPDFNLALARRARRAGIPVVQLVCPSVWAWRQGRVRRLRRDVDHVLCLYPFEQSFLDRHGVAASFIGHPLADALAPDFDREALRNELGIADDAPALALLPGSRASEIDRVGPVLLQAARVLRVRHRGLQLLTAASSRDTRKRFYALRDRIAPELTFRNAGSAAGALRAADAGLAASGTVTLEALLCQCPIAVAYRMHPLSVLLLRDLRLYKRRYFALPNLLARERLVPEFLQGAATAEALAEAVAPWLAQPARADDLRQRYRAIHQRLRRDAADRAAIRLLRVAGVGDGH